MSLRPKPRRQPLNPATVQLIKQLLWGLLVIGIVALFITAVWHISRLSAFTVESVVVTPGPTIDDKDVLAVVEPLLSGTYIGLIPKRFVYMYPEEEILEAVAKIPRVKDVSLDYEDTTLTISFGEYIPEALWCASLPAPEHCLFLDNLGFAFADAPTLSGGSFVRYYSLGQQPEVGQTPFSSSDFTSTRDFIKQLAETGWYVKDVEIDAVRDAFYTLTGGGELKVTLTESASTTIAHLIALRASEQFAHLTPDTFQYIDLRFGTKVFVNETPLLVDGVATSTASSSAELF